VEDKSGATPMKDKCPICSSHSTSIFLKRQNVPVHQNVLFQNQEQAQSINRGELVIAVCHDCGFVFNTAYSSKIMSYDRSYENTQNYSPVFEEYVNGTIDYLINQKNIVNRKIIEIGCGKGTFLRKLVEKGNNTGIGFDPSYIGPLENLSGKLIFKREFYDARHSDLLSDFVVCRHVLEHIEDPVSMLMSIHKAVQNSENVLVFFETPDVEWILQNKVVWDFFYEHCSYFSSQSIVVAFERAGFHVETVKKAFGGQYLWIEARPVFPVEPRFTPDVMPTVALAENFGKLDLEIIKQWKEKIINLRKDGNLLVWGAGAKGVTFANLFDPERKYIGYLVDVNPNKQAKYLPGTGHPIISPEEISKISNISAIIIMNPNYRDEIEEMTRVRQIPPSRLVEFSARSL
jgi:SAM-dependent methyltransferase